jgi:hypothetical protein
MVFADWEMRVTRACMRRNVATVVEAGLVVMVVMGEGGNGRDG